MAIKTKKINNTYVKLTSARGIKDTRNARVYSEVICKADDKHYFKEA